MRLLQAVVAAYLVMTLAFGLVTFTPDPNEAAVAQQAAKQSGGDPEAVQAAIQEYRASRGLDRPIPERYVDYIVDTARLDWGPSYSRGGQPVTAVIAAALPVTARYVLLALFLALAGGLGLGAYGALNHRSLRDRTVSVAVYGLFGLANFFVASLLLEYWFDLRLNRLFQFVQATPDWLAGPYPIVRVAFPGLVLATTLLASQVRYARAESLAYLDQEFVKLLRAKGAGPRRVVRHVVRNSAAPLLSLFFSELLSVVVIEALVLETVFGLGGIGRTLLSAVQARDLPLVIGITMTIAFIGIGASLLQDIAYRVLDPRVDD
jgi:peptide/nickel transport system permease protein